MRRLCARTGCAGDAVASCAFSYSDRLVWVSDLGRTREPSAYDLCVEHVQTLRVPRGWSLNDMRQLPRDEAAPKSA